MASNALLGEMRLAWWREALDEIYGPREVRPHPVAEALAMAVARRAIRRAPLETLIDARYRELDPEPFNEADALDWARDTGGTAAEQAVAILDPAADPALARSAGAAWALTRHGALQPLMKRLLAEAGPAVRGLSVTAFPAVAHAALTAQPSGSELRKRLRITWAVARGRI